MKINFSLLEGNTFVLTLSADHGTAIREHTAEPSIMSQVQNQIRVIMGIFWRKKKDDSRDNHIPICGIFDFF